MYIYQSYDLEQTGADVHLDNLVERWYRSHSHIIHTVMQQVFSQVILTVSNYLHNIFFKN